MCAPFQTNHTTASAFLDKSLFTTYTFDDRDDADTTTSTFQISLPALLETLQIFGLTDPTTSKPPWARDAPYPTSTAFTGNNIMGGMNNMCRISYQGPGSPLAITLTELSIRTECDLTTYKPEYADEIPFDRDALVLKVIMRGSWLYDAIQELASTTPEKLTMYAKTVRGDPFFALSSSGTLGSARVEFGNQSQNQSAYRNPASTTTTTTTTNANPGGGGGGGGDAGNQAPSANLLERFQLSDPDTVFRSSYKFSLIQKAARAMSVATKVSIRADTQGVLSLQFMIEVEGPGLSSSSGLGTGTAGAGGPGSSKNGFVDFRFVPLVDEEEDEGEAGNVDETIMRDADASEVSE